MIDIDTSRGKRTTQLDLDDPSDRQTFASLVQGADVFLQAYRPGGLSSKGFGVDDAAKIRPGIVYASLNAYGWDGPWKDRRGVRSRNPTNDASTQYYVLSRFDSLVQTATGFNVAEAEAYGSFTSDSEKPPKPFPMQALDHAAGYVLAFGIQAALCKTITVGFSVLAMHASC